MDRTAFVVSGIPVTWLGVLVAAGVAQLLIFALVSVLSRAKMPKQGLRSADRMLAISAGVFALLWCAAFVSLRRQESAAAAQAAANRAVSCSSVTPGMGASDVATRLGEPDEKRDDAETRGPAAAIWIYRGGRCAVHLLGDRVEFVE